MENEQKEGIFIITDKGEAIPLKGEKTKFHINVWERDVNGKPVEGTMIHLSNCPEDKEQLPVEVKKYNVAFKKEKYIADNKLYEYYKEQSKNADIVKRTTEIGNEAKILVWIKRLATCGLAEEGTLRCYGIPCTGAPLVPRNAFIQSIPKEQTESLKNWESFLIQPINAIGFRLSRKLQYKGKPLFSDNFYETYLKNDYRLPAKWENLDQQEEQPNLFENVAETNRLEDETVVLWIDVTTTLASAQETLYILAERKDNGQLELLPYRRSVSNVSGNINMTLPVLLGMIINSNQISEEAIACFNYFYSIEPEILIDEQIAKYKPFENLPDKRIKGASPITRTLRHNISSYGEYVDCLIQHEGNKDPAGKKAKVDIKLSVAVGIAKRLTGIVNGIFTDDLGNPCLPYFERFDTEVVLATVCTWIREHTDKDTGKIAPARLIDLLRIAGMDKNYTINAKTEDEIKKILSKNSFAADFYKSMLKLSNTTIIINDDNEYIDKTGIYNKIPKTLRKGKMIVFEEEIDTETKEITFHFLQMGITDRIAERLDTWTYEDSNLLSFEGLSYIEKGKEKGINITKENTVIMEYLAEQVTLMKNGKRTNKILLSTLYKECGIDVGNSKSRLTYFKNVIRAILENYKKRGAIQKFEETKEKGKPAIIITVPVKKKEN